MGTPIEKLQPAGWPRPKGYSNGFRIPAGLDLVLTAGMVGWDAEERIVPGGFVAQFEQALKDFSRTVELRPEYANAWFHRGEIHYEMGNFAKAVADYDRAVQLQRNDAGFYTARGHAYFQLRRFKQALDDHSRAVTLRPESSRSAARPGPMRSGSRQEAAGAITPS